MCFSAEASFGVAIALLPAGAYCIESAWRKDRRLLPLAIVPVFFGLQQLCEAIVWIGIGRDDTEVMRTASLGYLLFALAVWPVWIPLALAAAETGGWHRRALVVLAGVGLLFGIAFYLPMAADGGRGIDPVVLGHSIRYDLTHVPVVKSGEWWLWMVGYLAAVTVPLLVSRNRDLRPLGAAVALFAIVSYLVFQYAFASVWCFFAAILSLYLVRIHWLIPAPTDGMREPRLLPLPSN